MITKILRKLRHLFRRYVMQDPLIPMVEKWYRHTPTQQLLVQHSLPAKPVIWDIGGYIGEWSAAMLQQAPDAELHIFEPMPEFVAKLQKRFKPYPNVHIHGYALGNANDKMPISVQGEATSTFRRGGKTTTIEVRNILDVMKELKTKQIDLFAINAEGAEFDIFPELINAGRLPFINNLVIQFHRVGKKPESRRRALHKTFAQTHNLVFDFPFVWEKWTLKPAKPLAKL